MHQSKPFGMRRNLSSTKQKLHKSMELPKKNLTFEPVKSTQANKTQKLSTSSLLSEISNNLSTDQQAKLKKIWACLKGENSGRKEIDLWELRALAISSGGLLHPEIRKMAWPKLLGVFPTEEVPNTETMHSGNRTLSRDERNTIQQDVGRTVWRLDEKSKNEIVKGKNSFTTVDSILESTIISALLQCPTQLHYYQGYHDIASLLLLNTLSPSLTSSILSQISSFHLEDYMQENFQCTLSLLQISLSVLLGHTDEELLDHLQDTGVELQNFTLSWVIGWFSHDIKNFKVASRIMDACIVSHPTMPVYLSATLLLFPSNRSLIMEAGSDSFSIYTIIKTLPRNMLEGDNVEVWIESALSLMERISPQDLILIANQDQEDGFLKESLVQTSDIMMLNLNVPSHHFSLAKSAPSIKEDQRNLPESFQLRNNMFSSQSSPKAKKESFRNILNKKTTSAIKRQRLAIIAAGKRKDYKKIIRKRQRFRKLRNVIIGSMCTLFASSGLYLVYNQSNEKPSITPTEESHEPEISKVATSKEVHIDLKIASKDTSKSSVEDHEEIDTTNNGSNADDIPDYDRFDQNMNEDVNIIGQDGLKEIVKNFDDEKVVSSQKPSAGPIEREVTSSMDIHGGTVNDDLIEDKEAEELHDASIEKPIEPPTFEEEEEEEILGNTIVEVTAETEANEVYLSIQTESVIDDEESEVAGGQEHHNNDGDLECTQEHAVDTTNEIKVMDSKLVENDFEDIVNAQSIDDHADEAIFEFISDEIKEVKLDILESKRGTDEDDIDLQIEKINDSVEEEEKTSTQINDNIVKNHLIELESQVATVVGNLKALHLDFLLENETVQKDDFLQNEDIVPSEKASNSASLEGEYQNESGKDGVNVFEKENKETNQMKSIEIGETSLEAIVDLHENESAQSEKINIHEMGGSINAISVVDQDLNTEEEKEYLEQIYTIDLDEEIINDDEYGYDSNKEKGMVETNDEIIEVAPHGNVDDKHVMSLDNFNDEGKLESDVISIETNKGTEVMNPDSDSDSDTETIQLIESESVDVDVETIELDEDVNTVEDNVSMKKNLPAIVGKQLVEFIHELKTELALADAEFMLL